jgi:two-component system, NtrC family, nitrogen regulation response regulator GlnG
MTERTILIAEDDHSIRTVVSRALSQQGFRVQATRAASTFWQWVEEGAGDAAIMDVMLPDENSLDILPQIKSRRPDLPIILMSAQNTLLTAVRATERGAFEYLPKPFDIATLLAAVQRALASTQTRREPGRIRLEGEENLPIIGRSPAMQEIYRVLARLVATDLTVLISGESGTGKELVARALHDFSRRRHGPFVALNMAAIPKELIESELFGHEKGAFTGASTRKAGRFEQAQGGTLFLDEIGDMPVEAQTRLLRVLQQGEFMPVGAREPIRADVRILAASHRELRTMVAQGLFREDLFYRLNVVPIRLPALRERTEDIPALVEHFLAAAHKEALPLKWFDPEAMQLLKEHDWPGNVRELENLVRRMVVLYSEDVIGAPLVELELKEARRNDPAVNKASYDDSLAAVVARHVERCFGAVDRADDVQELYLQVLQEVERPLIAETLAATRGNQLRAAQILGLNRNTLRKKIRDLEIDVIRSPR